MSKTYSAGIVTAYGAAKRAGYQGTYEDFCRQQAGYAENAAAVEQAKTTAVNAATTATTKAGEATTAATAAQTAKTQTEAAASQALTDISSSRSSAISAVQTEGATQTENATAQAQAAEASAATASTKASEASASATSAGQSATNAAASATSADQSARDAHDVLDSIPADYSEMSADVEQLKADLGYLITDVNTQSIWELGGISSANGAGSASTTRLRTINYIGKVKVVPSIGYKYIVCAYNDGAYVGMWNGTSFVKSATWLTDMTDLAGLDGYDSYDYKLVFANTSDGAITVADSANIALLSSTDDTLTKGGKSADAKATGRKITALESAVAETETVIQTLSNRNNVLVKEICAFWVRAGIYSDYGTPGEDGSSTTRIRTLNSLIKTKRIVTASGYKFMLFAYHDLTYSSYVGIWNGTSFLKTATWLSGDVDLSDIDGDYYYKVVLAKTDDSAILTSDAKNITIYASPQSGIYGLPVISFTGDISAMTKDNAVSLTYNAFGVTGTANVKWQGSSSLRYRKKNYTIKFDSAFDGWDKWRRFLNTSYKSAGNITTLSTDSRWGSQTKYCAKSNWIDPSMARNIVCARIWGEIVKNRVDAGDVTDARSNAPNYGAIDGFPVEIKINGTSYGLFTLNIPKDKWMFGMGSSNTEYLISGEGNANLATRWKSLATINGEDYSVEYAEDEVETTTITASLNNAIQAAIDAGADWETTLAPYVDIDSVFDYFIFTCCVNNHDALARNILYGTYDGVKWFMSAYDMDTTFGSDAYGTAWYSVVNDRNQFAQAANMHRLAYLMYTYSKTKLKARYNELRAGILSDAHVWYMLSQFVVNISKRNYDINNDMWIDMPGTSTADIAQYMEYYKMHCAYLDSEIDALVN